MIKLPKNNSFLLFGARGTGKSTLISSQMNAKESWTIDLLDPQEEDRYIRQPSFLEMTYNAQAQNIQWIFIDEIQRAPRLLDSVHRMIEKQKILFALTGSSARKLKRGAANLLAGRAFVYHLFPLTTFELGSHFNLDQVLQFGSLPKIFSYTSNADKAEFLRSYALTYLKEEIQSEQLLRKLDPFRDFLEVGAQCNGKILNFSKIAREVGVDSKTVHSYFQILEETWMGFYLPIYHKSVRKSQLSHPKFYWFDPGVKKALERSLDMPPSPGTSVYGEAFEHWIILEFYRHNQYSGKDYKLCYFQTSDGGEIDLVIHRGLREPILVEIKSSSKVDPLLAKRFERTSAVFESSEKYLLSQDPIPQKIGQIQCLPWQMGIKKIFQE